MKLSEVIKMEISMCDFTNPSKIRKHLIDKIGVEVAIEEIKHIQAKLIGKKIYIITAEPIEQFNCKNESMGMSEKLAVFYSPQVGRKRYYRNSLNNPGKGLKLLSFKTEKSAQKVCDITNEISQATYKVEAVY